MLICGTAAYKPRLGGRQGGARWINRRRDDHGTGRRQSYHQCEQASHRFGPSVVINSFFGAAYISMVFSYSMPFFLLLWRSYSYLPKYRYFNLGYWGPVLNVITICWQLIIAFFYLFPSLLSCYRR